MTESYKSILEMIKISEKIRFDCKERLAEIEQFLLKKGPKGYGKSTSYMDADCVHGDKAELGYKQFQDIYVSTEKLKDIIRFEDENLIKLYKTKNEINSIMDNLRGSGIIYDVAYLKLVEGYPLQKIADELHISESYTMKLSAKIK